MTGLIVAMSGGKSALAQNAQLSASMRRMVGSGLLVAVGYIDPGNWATDIAGGSGFGYGLLSVVIASALLALGFQVLVSRLALATGQDLATLTARHLSPAWPRPPGWPARPPFSRPRWPSWSAAPSRCACCSACPCWAAWR